MGRGLPGIFRNQAPSVPLRRVISAPGGGQGVAWPGGAPGPSLAGAGGQDTGVKRRVGCTGPGPLDGRPGSWGPSNVHTGKMPREGATSQGGRALVPLRMLTVGDAVGCCPSGLAGTPLPIPLGCPGVLGVTPAQDKGSVTGWSWLQTSSPSCTSAERGPRVTGRPSRDPLPPPLPCPPLSSPRAPRGLAQVQPGEDHPSYQGSPLSPAQALSASAALHASPGLSLCPHPLHQLTHFQPSCACTTVPFGLCPVTTCSWSLVLGTFTHLDPPHIGGSFGRGHQGQGWGGGAGVRVLRCEKGQHPTCMGPRYHASLGTIA